MGNKSKSIFIIENTEINMKLLRAWLEIDR
jgi:hypothetical protein